MSNRLDPQTLALWLEWAAIRLIAMPAGRLKPDEPRAYWPDFKFEPIAGLTDLQTNRIRALAPSAAEIPIVDLIILLPNLSSHRETRLVLHWRAQVHPLSNRRLLSWDWITQKLHVKRHTAQRWHKLGLSEVADKAPMDTVYRITTFMRSRT
jgi:hypothetical protein